MTKPIRRTGCPRKQAGFESGKGLEYCVAAHGEANAIAQAARMGVAIRGSQMVIYGGVPCKNCAVLIVNSGILEVYCASGDVTYDNVAEEILREAGVKLFKLEIIGLCINQKDAKETPDTKIYSLVNIAKVISLNSKCMSRKVGSVVVRDGCIISTGYNGPARRASHCDVRTYGLPKKKKVVCPDCGETYEEDFEAEIGHCDDKRADGSPSEGCDEFCVNCHKDPAKCEESSLYEGELTPTSVRLSAIRESKRQHDAPEKKPKSWSPSPVKMCVSCKGKGASYNGMCGACGGTGWETSKAEDVSQGSVDPE